MMKALKILWSSARADPETATVTLRALCAKAMMARNTQMLLAGKCPHEMAFGHRPPLLCDAETAPASTLVPDEVLPSSLRRDRKISQLAVDAYLKARQSEDLRRDLAQKLLPSHGPFHVGQWQ